MGAGAFYRARSCIEEAFGLIKEEAAGASCAFLECGFIMKKIGILNFQYSNHNYGAVLQAAALEYVLRELGHEPKHIDFIAQPKVSLKGLFGKLLRQLSVKKTSKVMNEEAFERFRLSLLNRTARIRSMQDFSNTAGLFDVVLVGSDQVWRPAFAKDTIAFFLGYVPQGVDRVSYAASFGTETWEQANDAVLTLSVREELRQFKAISCREESGVEICNEVFGVEAVHVLDPLLMIDDAFFDKIISQSSVAPGAKLVYYKLDASADFQADLEAIGARSKTTAVNIYLKESSVQEYREVFDWVAMIHGAETVVTDSFHCICLALRFGKEVIYCPNEKRGKTRLDSLFKKLNVQADPLDIESKTPMFSLIRQGDIDTILEEERKQSLKFLRDALHG